MKRATSEIVTAGTETIGSIISNERGHEAYGPDGRYIATHTTLAAARKALWVLSQEKGTKA